MESSSISLDGGIFIPLATKIPLCWQQEQGFSNADWSVLS